MNCTQVNQWVNTLIKCKVLTNVQVLAVILNVTKVDDTVGVKGIFGNTSGVPSNVLLGTNRPNSARGGGIDLRVPDIGCNVRCTRTNNGVGKGNSGCREGDSEGSENNGELHRENVGMRGKRVVVRLS